MSTGNDPIGGLAESAARFVFFTGKGGVGKTSVACATAVRLADSGKRVLLISTDPASNLDEVLGILLNGQPTDVPGVAHLRALNLDPVAEAAAYRERVVGPYRGIFPDAAVTSMEEQLSGACTTEIAAFDRFTAFLAEDEATAEYDHVVFDTAPTGHTLRLLALPSAWTGFIAANTTGTSCIGPLQGLNSQQVAYARAVEVLGDPAATTIVLVTRPETSALGEAERTRNELAALRICSQKLVVNGVFETGDATDEAANALMNRGRAALANLPAGLAALERTSVALRPDNIVGVNALRALGTANPMAAPLEYPGTPRSPLPPLEALVDELGEAGRGVIMTMGKGGVGKTTLAAAIASELARRGFPVYLTTTDPAGHVIDAMRGRADGVTIGRIDPEHETRLYREQVMNTAGATLDADARALLEEDLRSPCTEEIAVFRAFARTVAAGADGFVVLDTAPTGHTLLLLDASEAYHREVLRNATELPPEVRELLPRLRDPEFTRVLIVTLAEPTPVHEAGQLQQDLERAGIRPYAWIVNRSLADMETRDPVLRARGA
ncbi:MAG TPA: arsenical pump-driving ATPase, partial [Longimicrobiales bacterium]